MRGLSRGRLSDSRRRAEERPRLRDVTRYTLTVAVILALFWGFATGSTTGGPGGPAASTVGSAKAPTPDRTPSARPADPVEAAITFTETPAPNPEALAAFYGQTPRWGSCGAGPDRCASVRVPVDYTQPGGKTVGIALRKVVAVAPHQRRGTLFINPGGPGGSGIGFAQDAGSVFGPRVLSAYDIVGFDPRGLGASGGFECLTDRDVDAEYAADPTPETPAERTALERAASERAAGCLRRGGELARHMGTESVARDLDILRDAVGDERLNYYGVSYGTLIGATYADLFDTRVGLMVLDSAVTPDGVAGPAPAQVDVDDEARAAAYAFEETFDDFVTACTDGQDCALGSNKTTAIETLVRFIDGLEKHPLPTDLDTLPLLTAGWAVTAVGNGLRETESWGDLVDALGAAIDGDGTHLADFAASSVYRNDDGTYASPSFAKDSLPVTCADWPASVWDDAWPSADVLQNHPLWARVALATFPECVGWKGTLRQNLMVGAQLPTPVLVIGNERDPVTPIDDTEAMADAFVRSRFVSVDAEGHGAYGSSNDCADKVVDDYLVDAVPPAEGFTCPAT